MVTRNIKSRAGGGQERGEVRLRGKRLPTLDKELAIVRTGSPKSGRMATRRSDQAEVIFQGRVTGKIFAYSVDPSDATRIVREARDGTRRIGRVVGGKFKLAD
jgi:hypothetical protein